MLGRASPSTWSLWCSPAFLSHSICSQPLAASPREDIRGDSSCFPAFAALAFLNVIRLFLWARWKDASGERKYLMPQQFFLRQNRKGYWTWEPWTWSPLFLVWERGHCTESIYQPCGPDTQHGNDLTPIHQLNGDNSTTFFLALKLLYLCSSPWESWDMEMEDFILWPLPLLSFHILILFKYSFIHSFIHLFN